MPIPIIASLLGRISAAAAARRVASMAAKKKATQVAGRVAGRSREKLSDRAARMADLLNDPKRLSKVVASKAKGESAEEANNRLDRKPRPPVKESRRTAPEPSPAPRREKLSERVQRMVDATSNPGAMKRFVNNIQESSVTNKVSRQEFNESKSFNTTTNDNSTVEHNDNRRVDNSSRSNTVHNDNSTVTNETNVESQNQPEKPQSQSAFMELFSKFYRPEVTANAKKMPGFGLLARVSVAATGGLAAVAGAAIYLTNKVKSWADGLSDTQRQLAGFNGSIAESFATLEANRVGRSVQAGSETRDSTKYLNDAIDRMESTILPFQNIGTNVLNNFAGGVITFLGRGIELMEIVATEIPIVGEKVEKWIKDREADKVDGLQDSAMMQLFELRKTKFGQPNNQAPPKFDRNGFKPRDFGKP